MPKIENWSIGNSQSVIGQYLIGKVYGHEKIEDGRFVRTSYIKDIDIENSKIETRNTVYELGQMSEDFKEHLKRNNVDLKDYKNRFEEYKTKWGGGLIK